MVFVEFNSFTMVAFRNINPRAFLEMLMAKFPFVYADTEDGPTRIHDTASKINFIHRNMVQNECVDDLLCRWSTL